MALSVRDRELLTRVGVIAVVSAALGAVYGPFINPHASIFGAAIGALTGATIGTVCSVFDLFYVGRRRGERFRRLPYLASLGLRTTFYSVVIVFSIWIWAVIGFSEDTRWRLSDARFLATVGYAFGLSLAFNFVTSTQRLVGPGVMAKYLSGRYYRPREEERIFMFLDLADSTEIAERIGHLAFHRLLNRFCYDISEPIAAHHGEIYKYVGDEVIVTWPIARGVENASCVRCYFDVKDAVSDGADGYRRDFGVVPTFRAGLHGGTVVTGELGDTKQEIAFLGDTVNTTARIEQLCRERHEHVLISGDLLSRLALPDEYRAESIGATKLRGKETPIELFTLARA